MRYMITAAPDPNAPPRPPPDEALIASYMKFNEEMHAAGVLVASVRAQPCRQERARRGE